MKFYGIVSFLHLFPETHALRGVKSQQARKLPLSSQVPRAEITLIGVDYPQALKSLHQPRKAGARMNASLFIADSADMLK